MAPRIGTRNETIVSTASKLTGTPGRWASMAMKCVHQTAAPSVSAQSRVQPKAARPRSAAARRNSCITDSAPAPHISPARSTSQGSWVAARQVIASIIRARRPFHSAWESPPGFG